MTLVYYFFEGAICSVFLLLFILLSGRERRAIGRVLANDKRQALLTGIGIYATYSIVLVAMSYARDVSYIIGFRQLSIPVGALMGIVLLKEPRYRPKLAGLAVICVGLFLIAVG
jgi:drug/metabolite transporter (DMT)-like permease